MIQINISVLSNQIPDALLVNKKAPEKFGG
jgi:hypothetical protein